MPGSMDIFNNDAFSLRQLVGALDKRPYKPQFLGDLGIFSPKYLMGTDVAMIEKREGTLSLIQTSNRGAAGRERENEKRDIRPVATRRIKESDTITASELLKWRRFGTENELVGVASEVGDRMEKVRDDIEYTWEHHRLGAVQGIVSDADGSTLDNWFTFWDITQPAEVNFALTTDTTLVRAKCQEVRRAMQRAAKGAWTPSTTVHALCADDFFDALIDHPNVRATYTAWAAAAELRQDLEFRNFPYGGIMFHNYRGDDTNAEVFIEDAKVKFFPVGARDVFNVIWAPGESFSDLEGEALPLYPKIVPDRDREQWVDVEMYSYPLYICMRPEMLQRGRLA